MKKVLRLKIDRFLYSVHSDRVVFTDHIKHAMDISDLPLDVLTTITRNLVSNGYTDLKIVEVKK